MKEQQGQGGGVVQPTITKQTKSAVIEVNVDDLENAPQDHPSVDLGVLNQDVVIWFSFISGFKMVSLDAKDPNHQTPNYYPFHRKLKAMKSVKTPQMWKLNSGAANDEVTFNPNGEVYKPTFQRIDDQGNNIGNPIDPHIAIFPNR